MQPSLKTWRLTSSCLVAPALGEHCCEGVDHTPRPLPVGIEIRVEVRHGHAEHTLGVGEGAQEGHELVPVQAQRLRIGHGWQSLLVQDVEVDMEPGWPAGLLRCDLLTRGLDTSFADLLGGMGTDGCIDPGVLGRDVRAEVVGAVPEQNHGDRARGALTRLGPPGRMIYSERMPVDWPTSIKWPSGSRM